jgi:OPA family sugar phosphate sensor protein UhpC-like MFS transporter
LPPIEQFRNDYGGSPAASLKEEQPSTKEILMDYVLKNRYMWLLAAAYFFVYVVRTGVNDWTALYLRDAKGYSLLGANGCVSLFEVGGVVGSLCAGWASDYFFEARRGPINTLFAIAMVVAIALFWGIPAGHPWMDSAALFIIGFAIFGPQMMIGIAAAELSHKKGASTSTGFVGTFAYIGAAVAGYPMGKISQDFGWGGYFWFMLICCIISVALLLPMWSVTDNKKLTLAKSST